MKSCLASNLNFFFFYVNNIYFFLNLTDHTDLFFKCKQIQLLDRSATFVLTHPQRIDRGIAKVFPFTPQMPLHISLFSKTVSASAKRGCDPQLSTAAHWVWSIKSFKRSLLDAHYKKAFIIISDQATRHKQQWQSTGAWVSMTSDS